MRNLLIMLLALCLPSGAVAAEKTLVLSWVDCQQAALKNNPSLVGYRQSLEASRYNYYASRNQDLPFPGISASHSYSRSATGSAQYTDGFSAGLSASESLFSVSSYLDLKTKLKSIEQADLSLRKSLADTRKALLTAFIGLVYAQEKVGVMEAILEIRTKNAETIALQYESGRESYGNRLQTDAQLEQSKTDLMQARLDLITAQRSLASAAGLDEFVTLVASGTLSVPESMTAIDVDETASSMLSVLSARKNVELSELSLKQAGSSAFPSLSASQSLGWNGVTEPPKTRNWQLGLSLSWPILSNGPTYLKNAKAAARSGLLKVQSDLRSALFDAKYNLQSAVASLEVGMATVRTSKMLLEAARQRHEESEIKYLAGTLIYQNWQDIEQTLVSAEQSYLNSLKTVNTARAQLDNLLNVPLGD